MSEGEKLSRKVSQIPWKSNLDATEIQRRNLAAGKNRGIIKKEAVYSPEQFEEELVRKIDGLADYITAVSQKEDPSCTEVALLAEHPALTAMTMDNLPELSGTLQSIDNFDWAKSKRYLAAAAWRYKQLRAEQKQLQIP